jgi:hypothetical protein
MQRTQISTHSEVHLQYNVPPPQFLSLFCSQHEAHGGATFTAMNTVRGISNIEYLTTCNA